MGVKIPEYRIAAAHDLPHLRKHLKGGGKSRINTEELSLTSMIDMFSVIILFLIQSFSATGEILLSNPDIKIPEAYHARELTRSPIITVMMDKVILEGAAVGDNTNINEKIEETDWDLPQLSRKLEDYKAFFEGIHTDQKFPGDVILQADKGLPFVYLKRVMYTLVKLGFVNINLAVRGEVSYSAPVLDPLAPPTAPGSSGGDGAHQRVVTPVEAAKVR